MKDETEPPRIRGPEGLDRLRDFTRRILAVPKAEIADKINEPIYKPRKRKRQRRRTTKSPP